MVQLFRFCPFWREMLCFQTTSLGCSLKHFLSPFKISVLGSYFCFCCPFLPHPLPLSFLSPNLPLGLLMNIHLPISGRVFSDWSIVSLLPLAFWRSALRGMERRGQHTFDSYQPLDMMSYLTIISCPTYITSPPGKGRASTCGVENREPCWHLANVECCPCKVSIIRRCE